MKKNIFFKSTFILLIGGCITRILGLIIKIFYTRLLGEHGISLYTQIMPTYSLLLAISNFNIMVSVSKRISETTNNKKVIINACYIMFILNTVLIIIMLFLSKYISTYLLKNKDTYYPLLACTLTIPFISLGYIIKGYFYGKQNVFPHMISNVIEQISRLIIIQTIIPKVIPYGIVNTVTVLILITILHESISILIFLLYLPSNINIRKEEIKIDYTEAKEIMKISIPSIASKLIGNIGFFLEPIILNNILIKKGLQIEYITTEYGAYHAYAISTLLFPSFFISAISNALLPEISKLHSNKNNKELKKRITQSLLLSLIIGIVSTTIIFIFKKHILYYLYKTQKGISYIKVLAPFFILYYLEGPLSTILISLNKIKDCTIISIKSTIIKLALFITLLLFDFKFYSLVISEIISIVYITIKELIIIKNHFRIT